MKEKRPGISALFLRVMGDSRRQGLTIPLLAIALSLVLIAILLLLLDTNPLQAYQSLLQGSGLWPKEKYAGGKSILTDFTSFLNAWVPLVFASLSVAVGLRAGLFNIAVSGQMLLSGFVATVTVGYSDLPAVLAKPLVLVVALVVGATVGALVGWLKYRFNINEVVSTIMLNYLIQFTISFFINTYWINPVSRQSEQVSPQSRLTLVDVVVGDLKMDIPLGVILALLVAPLVLILLEKTTLGFQMKSVGCSPSAARYSGMDVGKTQVLAMVISGGLAGLAGATYYLGLYASIPPKTLVTLGFDGVAVSLLAGNNPIGILFSSFLVTIISKGSTYLSSSTGLPSEIASVITGLILLVSACGGYFRHLLLRLADRVQRQEALLLANSPANSQANSSANSSANPPANPPANPQEETQKDSQDERGDS